MYMFYFIVYCASLPHALLAGSLDIETHPDVELETTRIEIDESINDQCRIQFIVSVSIYCTRVKKSTEGCRDVVPKS